jgi:two-component system sensor histidine kinase KdpD
VFVNQAALALERALLAEEAEKSQVSAETERLRSALLSSVSHDFRTPLAAVTGAATSLLQEGDKLGSEARTELLQTIREESERLGRIVTDLLEITRIESGAVQVRKEWCPLEEVIGSALARLEGKLAGREVKVDLTGPMLQAPLDAVLAEQLFFNLIENAVKYTPAGSPIEIHAHEADRQVVVEIRDRGPGIAPGDEQRIFERFYRSPDGGRVGGAGLGLAVCQAVVRAHGGDITARSREGGGTVFRFTLPVEGTPPVIDDGTITPSRK